LSSVNASFTGSTLDTIAVAIGEDVDGDGGDRWNDNLEEVNNLVGDCSSRKNQIDFLNVAQLATSGELTDGDVMSGWIGSSGTLGVDHSGTYTTSG